MLLKTFVQEDFDIGDLQKLEILGDKFSTEQLDTQALQVYVKLLLGFIFS